MTGSTQENEDYCPNMSYALIAGMVASNIVIWIYYAWALAPLSVRHMPVRVRVCLGLTAAVSFGQLFLFQSPLIVIALVVAVVLLVLSCVWRGTGYRCVICFAAVSIFLSSARLYDLLRRPRKASEKVEDINKSEEVVPKKTLPVVILIQDNIDVPYDTEGAIRVVPPGVAKEDIMGEQAASLGAAARAWIGDQNVYFSKQKPPFHLEEVFFGKMTKYLNEKKKGEVPDANIFLWCTYSSERRADPIIVSPNIVEFLKSKQKNHDPMNVTVMLQVMPLMFDDLGGESEKSKDWVRGILLKTHGEYSLQWFGLPDCLYIPICFNQKFPNHVYKLDPPEKDGEEFKFRKECTDLASETKEEEQVDL